MTSAAHRLLPPRQQQNYMYIAYMYMYNEKVLGSQTPDADRLHQPNTGSNVRGANGNARD